MRTHAALLLLLSALLVAACGGDGDTKTVVKTVTAPTSSTPPAGTPTTPSTPATTPTTAPDSTEPSPATATVRVAFFRTPSSNIGCAIAGGRARCDIKSRDWEPPPEPASCRKLDVDYGQGIEVGVSGIARFVCAGDTALNPTGPIVRYGVDSRVGGFVCASREDGVTCRSSSSRHGFFIARDRYQIF